MENKWVTLENESGTASLKQHCFIPYEATSRYTGELYVGNISLCGKVWAGNGDEEIEMFYLLDGETQHPAACKRCLKVYNSQPTTKG
jgi:hypothetical protein